MKPIQPGEKVYVQNTCFIDQKRRDGQVSAILLVTRRNRARRVKDAIELVAASMEKLDRAVAEWVEQHAENMDELLALAEQDTA